MTVLAKSNMVYCIGTNPLSREKEYKYIMIQGINKSNGKSIIYKGIRAVMGICKSIIHLPIYPASSFNLAQSYYKSACTIIEQEKIDTVVAVSFPGEAMIACEKLKKKYGSSIRTILYPLDVSIEGNRSKNRAYHTASCFFAKRNLDRQITITDNVIVLENASELYKANFPQHIHKMLFAGIPMIENIDISAPLKKNEEEFRIMYAGNISSNMYNPIPILSMLDREAGASGLRISFHLYGHADKRLLNKLATCFKNITFENHGWVDEEELNNGLLEADACLNIAKTVTNTIPSKFFKYMCLYKPILHYYYDDNDPCLDYLKKYTYSVMIKAGEQCNVKIIESIKNYDIRKRDLEKIFYTCTPQYTAELIASYN